MPQGSSQRLWIVTGAAGFIGGRMAQRLEELGYPVLAVDTEAAFSERKELRSLNFHKQMEPEALLSWLKEASAESISGILHMGAITSTLEFDAEKLRKANTDYSRALWEICVKQRLPFFYASSAATYGGGENGYSDAPGANWEALQPLNPYGWSKHHFDLWVRQQTQEGKTPPRFAGFKFFNVYGYGEAHKGRMASVVWHAAREIQATGKVTLFRSHRPDIADGHQKRDFVTVEDVVQAVLAFAQDPHLKSGIYNLGSGHARTFLDLATAVFHALGRPVQIAWKDTPVEIRDKYQYFTEADLTCLREAGYTAQMTGLEAGVSAAVRAWIASGLV